MKITGITFLAAVVWSSAAMAQQTDQTVQNIGNEMQMLYTQMGHVGSAIQPLIQERDMLRAQVRTLTEENKQLKEKGKKP